MFVQVIQGRVDDPEALRERLEAWRVDLMPEAAGFLGSTSGIADDGEFITAARFESADAARANSQSERQSAWWAETEKLLTDVSFYDCEDVDLINDGGSDEAGFVQVIQGYATDKEALRALGETMNDAVRRYRPDVLGGLVAWGPDNGFSQFIYFTSEQEARANEGGEPPEDIRESMERMMSLTKDMKYIDLRDPIMISP
jgi:hypothetical protein